MYRESGCGKALYVILLDFLNQTGEIIRNPVFFHILNISVFPLLNEVLVWYFKICFSTTVAQNIIFGLYHLEKTQTTTTDELLEGMGIVDIRDRFMRFQRTATTCCIGCSLAPHPKLTFDELANLDGPRTQKNFWI